VGKEHGMYYIGIDLHKQDLVMAVENEHGPVARPRRLSCRDVAAIRAAVERWKPFRAAVEASASYRWLYDLVSPVGDVVLAHPLRLRAIATARAKTDRLDAALLAQLLRANLIPASYVPPARYQTLRDLTRSRARLSGSATLAKNQVHALLARANVHPPLKKIFGVRGRRWPATNSCGGWSIMPARWRSWTATWSNWPRRFRRRRPWTFCTASDGTRHS
jgi:transposase